MRSRPAGAIARVDVSADGGRTWSAGRAGARRPRAVELDILECRRWTLPPGEHELAVRAWDSAGQTQPARPDDTWNFKGYLSAAWHRVRIVVVQPMTEPSAAHDAAHDPGAATGAARLLARGRADRRRHRARRRRADRAAGAGAAHCVGRRRASICWSAASRAPAWRHVVVLLGAGLLTGAGQLLLMRLSSGNGIDITAAIWFHAGRLPALRTLGSAVLSVLIVGMGASLGREGAPKQAGAVIANLLCPTGTACPTSSAGCWSPAAPGPAWPRPTACRWAARCSRSRCCAASWRCASCCRRWSPRWSRPACPGRSCPTRRPTCIPAYPGLAVRAPPGRCWPGLIAGLVSVGYVRAVAWADRHRPSGLAPAGGAGAGAWPLLGRGLDRAFRSCSATARTSRSWHSRAGRAAAAAGLAGAEAPAPRCCAWAAARRAGCSRRRWRWGRCSAACSAALGLAVAGRAAGPVRCCSAPRRCWPRRPRGRSRRSC